MNRLPRALYIMAGTGSSQDEMLRRQALLNRAASKRMHIDVCKIPDGPLAIESNEDEEEAIPHILSLMSRQALSYEAFIIGCAGDAGLQAARELVSIPVIGPSESALRLGVFDSKKFAMLTTNSVRAATKYHLVTQAGFKAEDLVASLAVNIPVLELRREPQKTIDAMIIACNEAKNAGASTIILSCMSLAFLEPEILEHVKDTCDVCIINPMITAIAMAEALVFLQQYK